MAIRFKAEEGFDFPGQHVRKYNGKLIIKPARKAVNYVLPKPEASSIVTKVDQLMSLCDALKARLSDARTTQLQLADAIVEQAVA